MSTILRGVGGWLLADAPGGVEELQMLVDPSLHEFLDELTPSNDEMIGFVVHSFGISKARGHPVHRMSRTPGQMDDLPAPS